MELEVRSSFHFLVELQSSPSFLEGKQLSISFVEVQGRALESK